MGYTNRGEALANYADEQLKKFNSVASELEKAGIPYSFVFAVGYESGTFG